MFKMISILSKWNYRYTKEKLNTMVLVKVTYI